MNRRTEAAGDLRRTLGRGMGALALVTVGFAGAGCIAPAHAGGELVFELTLRRPCRRGLSGTPLRGTIRRIGKRTARVVLGHGSLRLAFRKTLLEPCLRVITLNLMILLCRHLGHLFSTEQDILLFWLLSERFACARCPDSERDGKRHPRRLVRFAA